MPLKAVAQDRTNTILVLDGSGSMWGQIDGTAKITIAQTVVRDLLGTLPETQAIGLTVYGHRARGDCSDIETIVAPGVGTRGAISAAVDGIKPLGKTPMTDAVIAAANALRFTEEKATVVLVSDGVETCNPDPCAAARALEEAGIDFTAHVVGFDVGSDPDALAQMQCIASETGGQFLTAENATELSTALVTVAAEPAPPAPVTVTFRGRAGADGPVISQPLVWSIAGPDGQIATNEQAPSLALEVLPGDYRIAALWPQYEEIVELTARVSQGGIVDVVFPAPPPPPVDVTFRALDGRNGPVINDPLEWAFFQDGARLGDTLTGATITGNLPRGAYRVVVTRPADGATAEETFGVGTVDATITLVLPEFRPAATLDAPAEVVAGSTFDVIWTGPDAELDYIATARPDARPGDSETYTYTREGPLLKVKAPAAPGEYRLQYVLRDGSKVLVAQPLSVVPVAATLDAPTTGIAGETVSVAWEGPDYELDFISVVAQGDAPGSSINFTYTREGSPLGLTLPADPGSYLIRYVMRQDSTVLAERAIEVAAVGATLDAADTAVAGDTLSVTWEGPNYELDYIAVSKLGDEDGRYENFTYTREGSPLGLVMPTEPGAYEIRYTLRQDSEVIARRPVTVTAVGANVVAPATATAGETVTVDWSGPDYELDYIAVAKAGERGGRYENFTYTREGAPLGLVMPAEPGAYEIRYVMRQDGEVIASVPITVAAVNARLTAPTSATAGQTVSIDWTGPDYELDYISVAKADDRGGGYENFTYTREGSPLGLTMPAEPGAYEIRYVMRQDSTIVARSPVTVAPVAATLTAPDSVIAGAAFTVEWTGPDYELDFVEIVPADGRGRESFRYTRDGSPLELTAPDAPGAYELRYTMRQDNTVIATKALEVTE
ncbi:MAG: VWA domain-containing protein [Pseudomonadota bacterium]